MRNAEAGALAANIASLQDQLDQLEKVQEQDPLAGGSLGLWPEEEGEPEGGLAEILAALEAGEELSPEQVAELEEAVAGTELGEDLVGQIGRGETLSVGDLALLKGILEDEGGEELKAAEKVAAAIIERSLSGVPRAAAVPLLVGLPGVARGARSLVRKRFGSWEEARNAESPAADDLVRLFGGDVRKALPGNLELVSDRLGGEQEPPEDEESDVLKWAVHKMSAGLPLTEEEMAEALAANLRGKPLAGVTLSGAAHKALIPLNPRRPVESTCLQETLMEIRRMVRNEREDIVLNRQGRGGKRGDLVRKSLGAAIGHLFGQRE